SLARSRDRARVPRRDAARRGREGRALLLDVRPEVLLDEDHAGSAGIRRTAGRGRRDRRARAGAAREGGGVPEERRRDLPQGLSARGAWARGGAPTHLAKGLIGHVRERGFHATGN